MIKFKLREAMDNTHMNIEQLHEASGISRNTISLLLHGKMKGIRMSTLDSLATALKIDDVNELLEYQSKECPYCHSEENKDLPADEGTLAHIEGNGRTLEELGAFIDDKLKDVQDAIDSQMKKYLK